MSVTNLEMFVTNLGFPVKEVNVTATVRILSHIKSKPLTAVETFNHKVKIMVDVPYKNEDLEHLFEAETKIKFEELFLKRMKSIPALKSLVGGTRWKVDVLNIEYDNN